MRAHSRFLIPFAVAAVLSTAACGESGSSGTGGGGDGGSASGSACAPVEGEQLVMLEDDKKLQTVDNIIPAVAAPAETPQLLDALNAVSEVLTTEDLVGLVAAVDLERQGAVEVAAGYVEENSLSGVVPPFLIPSTTSRCLSRSSDRRSMQETLSQSCRWNKPTGSVWKRV